MSASAARPRFGGALRGETIKITRQLSFWLMLGAAVLMLAVIVLAISGGQSITQGLASDPTAWAYNQLVTFGTVFQIGSGIFLLIIGARLFGMEYSSGTIRIAYARGVGRLQLLLAKMLTLAIIGLGLLAGYVLLAGAILAVLVNALHGNLDPVQRITAGFWADVGRWAGVQAVSMGLAILMAAAAAAVGRSLAFAIAASLAWYPVDNFLQILEQLGIRVTGHLQPWVEISQYQLATNLNVLLQLWEPGHQARAAFAAPIQPVDLTHAALVIAAFGLAFAVVAVVRTARPDVLE